MFRYLNRRQELSDEELLEKLWTSFLTRKGKPEIVKSMVCKM